MNVPLSELSTSMLIVLVVVVLAQLALIVFAMVKWARVHSNTVGGSNKLVWLPVILLIQFFGAIAFLIVASRETIAGESAPTS